MNARATDIASRYWPARLDPDAPYPHPDDPKLRSACCRARIDDQGRLPVGYCSPTCTRRP